VLDELQRRDLLSERRYADAVVRTLPLATAMRGWRRT